MASNALAHQRATPEAFTRALQDYLEASLRYQLERREYPDVRLARANRMAAHAVALALQGELGEALRLLRTAAGMLRLEEEGGG